MASAEYKKRMNTITDIGYSHAKDGVGLDRNPYRRSDAKAAWRKGWERYHRAVGKVGAEKGIIGGKKVTGKWITPMYPPVPVVDDEVSVEATLFGVESVVRMQLAKLLSHDLELAGDRLHELAHVLKLVGEYNGGDKGYGELFKSIVGMLNVKEE